MNENKMDFDMKPGERLEVCERYVAVREKNDKVRIYRRKIFRTGTFK